MARKNSDPYKGWTHTDFNKEARRLVSDMNHNIDAINSDYRKGNRPDMSQPLKRIKFTDD